MAEIVQNPQPQGDIGTTWDALVQFLINYWWILLLVSFIIVLVVVIYYLAAAREEDDKRRDSSVYATAHNIKRSAEQNKNDKWVNTRWSFLNLLWFGIPFKKHEHSRQIVDIKGNLIGYYRGHTYTQNGDLAFLTYKTKSWMGLKEDRFLLYCPMSAKIPKRDEEGVIETDPDGNVIYEREQLPQNLIRWDKRGNEIIIKCNTVLKHGDYFHFPNYVVINGDRQEHIDLTKTISDDIAQQNFITLHERNFTDFSRAVGRAVESNPSLRIKQKEPDKEKKIEDLDDD